MSEKQELKQPPSKDEIISQVNKLVDAQDKPQDEKVAIKEIFSYMNGLNLSKKQASFIHAHPKYLQAAKDFSKDRSKSEIIINACNEILKEFNESE